MQQIPQIMGSHLRVENNTPRNIMISIKSDDLEIRDFNPKEIKSFVRHLEDYYEIQVFDDEFISPIYAIPRNCNWIVIYDTPHGFRCSFLFHTLKFSK